MRIGTVHRAVAIIVLGTATDFVELNVIADEENILKSNKISVLRTLTNGAVHG
jgi:hypothetical protein